MKKQYIIFIGVLGAVAFARYNSINSRGDLDSSGGLNTAGGVGTVTRLLNKVKWIMKSGEARGIRNNNPGNLEANGIPWQGLSKSQTDGRFYQFDEPFYGIRALGRDMYTKIGRGLNTPKKIIEVYAPSFENLTGAYYDSVAKTMGIGVNSVINRKYLPQMMLLVKAIIKHENGYQPYSAKLIGDAVYDGIK